MALFRRSTTSPVRTWVLLVSVVALLSTALQPADAQDGDEKDETAQADEPRRLGLVERAGTRLAQLDITVIGSPEAIATFGAGDLQIKINRRRILEFRLDRLCTTSAPAATGEQAPRPAAPPASYLFYFDQTHMTMSGRLRSLEQARELVGALIRDGDRGMIVSNARELVVFEPFTSDRRKLLDAFDRLEKDSMQWDTYAEQEEARIAEVIRVLNDQTDLRRAVGVARIYQKEEQWRADRSFRRLELTLGQLVDLDAPKALIVFSDTLRSNAGEHYLGFFGQSLIEQDQALKSMQASTMMASLSYDRVVNEAAAQSIRIYTVQAEGLVGVFDTVPTSAAMSRTRAVPTSSRERINDAQKTLRGLAGESGGHAFLNGVPAAKIGERILADSSCLFLVSFDPTGLREDMPLRAKVETDRDDVRLRVRGRLVVQSESARATSRLLRAFGSPGTIADPFEVTIHVIPTGFDDGVYSVLLQFSIPGIPLHGTTWDLGLSVVAGEKVHEESSRRLSLSGPGVPIVFEREVRLKPGSYDIVSVAHEASSGLIASDEVSVAWPDPGATPATVAVFALLQPASGAFVREGHTRSNGSLARNPQDPVLLDRPTALVGLVCGSRRNKGELLVERSLVGRSSVDFPPLSFDLHDGRCAQVRDLVPENTLTPGFYHYDLHLSQGGQRLHEFSREFVVADPGS
jgi:VWFA-related protein